MLPLPQTDTPIRTRLASELAEVETRFAAELVSDLACVNSLITHVERYRGKMLRPTLLLVSAMAIDPRRTELGEKHRTVAAVVEMVHMATLVHDDVLDEADVRRHGVTVNRLRGNEAAVMLGDYLISHAYHLCSRLDQPHISRIIAEATNTVCEGELLQLANRNNWLLDETTYFDIIRRKTASLCGTCCRLAAVLGNMPQDIAQGLYTYGEKLGVAFQIIDDLLDLVGSERTVGKTLGRDLNKGKLTLPLIRYLGSASAAQRQVMLDLLGGETEQRERGMDGERDDAAALSIARMLNEAGCVENARQCAAELVEQAKDAIGGLAESQARVLLHEMADAVLTREY